jgi:hypothetical protein
MFAAHDARHVMHARIIGDHRHPVVQRIGLAVQRQHLFARLRAAGHHRALSLARS